MNTQEFEDALKALAHSLGIDVSDYSPYYRYFISVMTQVYRDAFSVASSILDAWQDFMNPDSENFSVLAERFFAASDLYEPVRGLVRLLPSPDLLERLQPGDSAYYNRGDVTFIYDNYAYEVDAFVATREFDGTILVEATFHSLTPPAHTYIPRDTIVVPDHPDFVRGIILDCTEPPSTTRPAARELIRTLHTYPFATKAALSSAIEATIQLPVRIIEPGSPVMYRDLIGGW